jgi:hypothetical protein
VIKETSLITNQDTTPFSIKVGLNIIHSGGWPHKGLPYGRLEPYEGKLSRPVLRGLGVSNDPRLPGAASRQQAIPVTTTSDIRGLASDVVEVSSNKEGQR